MLKAIVLLSLICASFALENPFVKRAEGCHYSYEDSEVDGPANWGKIAACAAPVCNAGRRQSPIDIIGDAAFEPEAMNLNFSNYKEVDGLKFQNMGHTVQIFNADTTIGLSAGPLKEFYSFVQAHFHVPSEHTFNGAHYPLELHLVHSIAGGAKLAVLGFFFEHSTTPNAFLSQIEDALDAIPTAGNVTYADAHLEILLRNIGSYYHYSGSLTTPPCSEIVDWLFSSNVLKATPAQVEKFRNVIHSNSRPIQPRFNRLISEFKASGSNAVGSSTPMTTTQGVNGVSNTINFNFAGMGR